MNLFKDSALYIGGELFSKSIPFLLLPFLTNKLGVVGFGEMSYYQTLLSFFMIFLGFSQDGAIARYYYFYGKRSISLIITTCYLYTCIMTIIFLILCMLAKSTILAIVVIVAAMQTLFNTQLVLRQCQKLAKQYIILQAISAIFTGLLTVFLLTKMNHHLIEFRFIALLISYTLCVFIAYYIYSRREKIIFRFSVKNYKISLLYLTGFGLPLILHQLSGFMKGQFDRVLIYHNFEASELGIYSAAFQIASVLSIVLMSINKAVVPYFYEYLKSKKIRSVDVRTLAVKSMLLVPVPSLVSLIIPEHIWLTILGQDFRGVNYFISLFLFGIGLTLPYFILVNYLFYFGKNNVITYCSLSSTVIYLIAIFILKNGSINFIPMAMILANIAIIPLIYIACKKIK